MLFPTNSARNDFESIFGVVSENTTPTTKGGVHITVDHLTDRQAAMFALGQNLCPEDAADYMQQLFCTTGQPALPTSAPAAPPAPASMPEDWRIEVAQLVTAAITNAIPNLTANVSGAIALEQAKAAKVTSLEGAFATAVAANPADAVALANKLATAKSKVEAATTISEVNAVKL